MLIALFVFTGGNLVPGVSRDQFQPPSLLGVNSPMHLTAADFQDGVWARAHLNASDRVWGDLLVYDVYTGIGGLVMHFDSYEIFLTTNLESTGVLTNGTVTVGSYVVTDVFDTQLTPTFYGRAIDQPTGPLLEGQLTKFNDPAHFSVVFVDSVFTVYQYTSLV
jgi:hypothetical protein